MSDTFLVELQSDYTARRIPTDVVPPAEGKWECVDGEARIRWNDGWVDTLRVTKIAARQDGPETTASAVKISDPPA